MLQGVQVTGVQEQLLNCIQKTRNDHLEDLHNNEKIKLSSDSEKDKIKTEMN